MKAVRQHPLLVILCFAVGLLVGVGVMKYRLYEPSGRMGYRDLTNSELSVKVLEVTRALRDLAGEMRAADEQILARCDKQEQQAVSEPAKNEIRQACNEESSKAAKGLIDQYEAKYRAEVFILREEMLHRLPELKQKTAPPVLFSYPTNPLGLGEVASSLERLAKLLPKSA